MKNKNISTKDLTWELFEKTGEISYFMLYKALEDKDNKN